MYIDFCNVTTIKEAVVGCVRGKGGAWILTESAMQVHSLLFSVNIYMHSVACHCPKYIG